MAQQDLETMDTMEIWLGTLDLENIYAVLKAAQQNHVMSHHIVLME